MNQQSSISKVNSLFSSVLWLTFTIVLTASAVFQVLLSFSMVNLVNYVILILICIACWMLWNSARKNAINRNGLTIISGVLIAKIVFVVIGTIMGVIASIMIMVGSGAFEKIFDTGTVGIGLLVLAIVCVWFSLSYLYYQKLRNIVIGLRNIVDTGRGDVRVSTYIIVIMAIGAAMTLISVITVVRINHMLNMTMGYASQIYNTPYYPLLEYFLNIDLDGITGSIFQSMIGSTAKTIFIGILNCAVSIMSIVLLCTMRDGLPESSRTQLDNLFDDAKKHLQSQVCPQCSASVPRDAKFCTRCGAPMPEPQTTNCPNCGASVPQNARFCNVCGRQIAAPQNGFSNPQSSPANAMPQQQMQQAAPTPQPQQGGWNLQKPTPSAAPSPSETVVLTHETGQLNHTPQDTVQTARNGALIGIGGSLSGKSYQLAHGKTITIGRDPAQCQILVDESNGSISRKHCSVQYRADLGSYTLIDYSSNGVFIDGVQIPKGMPQMVSAGTEIQMGDLREAFRLQ